jgi:hypothetical protein
VSSICYIGMDAEHDTKKMDRYARMAVAARVRQYFAELRAELDADTDAFFQRVMQQAETRPGVR